MRKRTAGSLIFALFMSVASASPVPAAGIITEMSEPHYQSCLAQAVKWRDLLSQGGRHFYPAFACAGVLNGSYVVLFRFQPPDTEPLNFFGRHFSVLFDSDSDLIGMLRVKPEWADMSRADQKRAAATSALFIRRFTPGLWRYVGSQTVKHRDFEFRRSDGSAAVIKGVLSTFYDSKRRTYFFVMAAPDGSVMAFERNLQSGAVDFGETGRNWLYDAYLREILENRNRNEP